MWIPLGNKNTELPPGRSTKAMLLPAMEAASELSSEYTRRKLGQGFYETQIPLIWQLSGQSECQHLPGMLWVRIWSLADLSSKPASTTY